MQLSDDAPLADAVDADRRTLVWKVEADWNKDGLYDHELSDLTGFVESVSVNRDITGSLPAETTLVEGYYSAQLNLRLGGKQLVWITEQLAPWREDSPLYGVSKVVVPIRYFVGHRLADGTETTPQQFQGKITECRIDGTGVRIVATDMASSMQSKLDLPAFALPPVSSRTAGLNLPLHQNSQWVVDHVLRKNGYYMSPPPISDDTFYCSTMHGSPVPERGHQATYWIGEGVIPNKPYQSGRPGWGLAWGGFGWYGAVSARGDATTFKPAPGKKLAIQFQVDLQGSLSGVLAEDWEIVTYSSGNGYLAGSSIAISITGTGRLKIVFRNGASAVASVLLGTLPDLEGWNDVWIVIEFNNPLSTSWIRTNLGDEDINLGGLPTSPATELYPHVFVFAKAPIHDLQLTDVTTTYPAGPYKYDVATWVPGADLDTGLNDITGLPLRRGVNSWDLLKEVVGVEFGVVGFSEAGRPFFRNRNTIRRSTIETVKVLTHEKVLTELGMSEVSGGVRNHITSSYAPRLITGPTDDPTKWDVIYSISDASGLRIPPGKTTWDVTLDEPGAYVDGYVMPTQFTTAQWNDPALSEDTKHGFVATTGAGFELTSGMVITSVIALSTEAGTAPPDRVRITISNTSGQFVEFKTPSGEAAFRLRGRKYYNGSTIPLAYKRTSSVTKHGERALEMPQSDWYQLPDSLQRISISLLKDLANPIAVVDQIGAVGDCRLQLQDTVEVRDQRLGGPTNCILLGITRNLEIADTGGKLTDTLNVRPVSTPGQWILGHPVWSILGETTRL